MTARAAALAALPVLVSVLVSCGGKAEHPVGRDDFSRNNGAEQQDSRRVIITYSFTVTGLAETERAVGWLPVPPTDSRQTLQGFTVSEGVQYEELTEEECGNTILRFDLAGAPGDEEGNVTVSVTYDVTRKAYRATDEQHSGPPDPGLSRCLTADSLIPEKGPYVAEAKQVAGSESDPLKAARLLYDNIVATVSYDKSGEGWGRGDALYACDVRKGNCTDFHSLFIGEARSLSIPARFIMGLPVPPEPEGEIKGYHCWAEFWTDAHGWVPIDASEASKNPDRKEELFGGLDADRIAFSTGRDIALPGAEGPRLNYFIFPYVEVEGAPLAKERLTRSITYREARPPS